MQLYFDPKNQGWYVSRFLSGGWGFLELRGDIWASIVPKDFRVPPTNIQEAIDAYFHRKELEDWALMGSAGQDHDGDQDMSTDMEAAQTVNHLCVSNPVASAFLQAAVHESLAPATAPHLEE